MFKIILGIKVWAIILIFSSCRPEGEIIEGDLYFRDWVSMVNFYNLPDSFYLDFIKVRDSIGYDNLIKDHPGVERMRVLDENDLLKSRFIRLRIQEDSAVVVFLDSIQYQRFIKYDYSQLIENPQKIRVKLRAKRISNAYWVCKSILTTENMQGQTYMKRGKFKVENYH